jgi:hypothetical protein
LCTKIKLLARFIYWKENLSKNKAILILKFLISLQWISNDNHEGNEYSLKKLKNQPHAISHGIINTLMLDFVGVVIIQFSQNSTKPL